MIRCLSPREIEDIRLSVLSFGFASIAEAIEPFALKAMQEEAEQRMADAQFAEQSEDLKYRANITSLGSHARDFLCIPPMLDLLAAVFDRQFVLTEQRSCLTFYKEGDHLGPHVDRPAEECDVTIIIYISATGRTPGSERTGLQLRIYGNEKPEDSEPRLTIPTQTGGIVIGQGSQYWHERPLLEKGEQVIAVTGCYGCAV